MTTTSNFPYTSTLALSPAQAADAYLFRKSFPRVVRDSKGGERGGLNIRLHDDCLGITIGATKQSFINVVTHKTAMFFASQARRANAPALKPNPKPKASQNAFSVIQEVEPDTHVVMFGKNSVPLTPGTTFSIQQGGFRMGVGQYTGPTQNDLRKSIRDVLVASSRGPPTKAPPLGKAKPTVVPDHSWNGSARVLEGRGMLAPPRPSGWFGLKEMETHTVTTLARLRRQKIAKKTFHRRQNKDETNEKGEIVDLDEYLQARQEEDNEAIALDPFDDDDWEEELAIAPRQQEMAEDVPDSWDDDC